MYLEALKNFPPQDSKLKTQKGIAFCQKADIFKETLWFSYKDDPANWHALDKEQVLEILELNKNNEKIASLEEYAQDNISEEKMVFENVVGQDSLTRFDKPKRKKRNNKKRRKNKPKARPNAQ
jgi:beta-xylosidase